MRWIRPLVLFSLMIGVANGQAPTAAPTALQQGTPIERSVGPNQTHSYTVTADEKSSVQVTVEQRGVDVVVSVFSPAGRKLGEYDSPNGTEGSENVSFVVVEQGAYRIDVTPLNAEAASGRYQIKIGEIREATEDEIKTSKNLETLRARALALIEDIEGLIAELRTPQSRIKAQFQAANLLWETNEKGALKYISSAIAGFKELRTATETNAPEYFRIYDQLSQLRYEMAYLLMTRQPEMALDFVRSTPAIRDPYNNPYAKREQVNQQSALEIEIANYISRTDPKRAVEVAREALKSGYSQNLVSTLNLLREKKPEFAAELAGDVVNKLVNEKALFRNPEAVSLALIMLRIAANIPRVGIHIPESQMRAAPLLSEQQRRDLLQKLVNEAVAYKPSGVGYSPERDMAWNVLRSLQSMGPELDSVVSGGSALLEKRAGELGGRGDPRLDTLTKYQNDVLNLPVDEALAAVPRAPKEFHDNLYLQLAQKVAASGDTARAKQILNDNVSNAYQRWQALQQLEQQATHQAMSKGKIEEALRNIANLPTVEERASMINQIIEQIGTGHKRAAALAYLEQARALFSPSVRAQGEAQMGALCAIAKAFSRYDQKRAFEILDPLVDQLNDLSDAARVLEGFGGRFYEQDELAFSNGNAVASAATQITHAIAALAMTNFDRAKLMSDRIKLPEVRLLAYMTIAQQALQVSRQ